MFRKGDTHITMASDVLGSSRLELKSESFIVWQETASIQDLISRKKTAYCPVLQIQLGLLVRVTNCLALLLSYSSINWFIWTHQPLYTCSKVNTLNFQNGLETEGIQDVVVTDRNCQFRS